MQLENDGRLVDFDDIEIARLLGAGFGRGGSGHRAFMNLVRGPHDAALLGLAKDLGETHDRQRPRGDNVREHHAGPDRGKLIDVPHEHQAGFAGRAFKR